MKIRTGFVSNSSSSSFLLAADKETTKLTMTVNIDVDEFVQYTISNIKELGRYYSEELEYEKDDDGSFLFNQRELRKYNALLDILNSGKELHFVSISSEGGNTNELFIYEHGFIGNVNFTVVE
jgi:hypothetical protein